MAEAVLFDVAKSLLQQLSSPLKDEFFLLWTSKGELKKLRDTISTIKGVLQDAEQKQATNPAIKMWLKRLQEEMYKADDLFDEMSTRALQKRAESGNKIAKEVRLFFSKSNHLVVLVSTAHKVKELRGRLDDVANDINKFGFIKTYTEPHRPRISRRDEWSYVKADGIIGRGKDRESILSILKEDSVERVSVAVIVGIGGLGKTALAQLVYNELKQDQEQFELYLWACVNDFSNMELVLQKIIACNTKEKCKGLQLEQLQNMLRKNISGKKYLLILDDVWNGNRENWLRLKGLLEVGGIGSKILVTTRSKVVAQNLSTDKSHYNLKGLSDDDAWYLFKFFAFEPNDEEKIHKMEKIGRDIVKRCANVPLAIRAMGSFLCYKDERRWSNVLNNEIPDGITEIMDVLQVSYDDLPSSLKHCFAYCSIFPKDHVFDINELIRMWMAQGFIESSHKQKSLEDVGEDNFHDLLQRCFFQDVQKDNNGRIIHCKMHDLLHDLAIKVSGRDCRMVECSTDNLEESLLHALLHHKAGHSMELPPSLLNLKGLRTLIYLKSYYAKGTLSFDGVSVLKGLRVLNLDGVLMEELPSSIGNLVHLRYLNLSNNELLIKLPDSICKLQNLQTLDVSWCRKLKKLPDDLRLLSLRHLLNNMTDLSCMPSGLKQMTSLVSLPLFVVDSASGGLRYLRDLNQLREEIIIKLPRSGWKNSVADANGSTLRSKTELTGLHVEWVVAEDAMRMLNADEVLDQLRPPQNLQRLELSRFPGTRMPAWISSLENLKRLNIVGCAGCQQLPPLWQLRSLTSLAISRLDEVEYMENDICLDTHSFFPSLVYLRIWSMAKLKGWWRQTATHTAEANMPTPFFPVLSDVYIESCRQLTDMPLIPCIKKLKFCIVNEMLVRQSVSTSSRVAVGGGMEELVIHSVENLVSMPEEWGQHLSTLRKLDIRFCPNFKTVPHAVLRRLASVEELDVSGYNELKMWNDEREEVDEMTLTSLKRFKSLIIGLHQLKGLHHLTALEKLHITALDSSGKGVAPTSWVPPPNLVHLQISWVRHLSHLNGLFHQLTKLASLRLYSCNIDFVSAIPWEALLGLWDLSFDWITGMKGIPEGCTSLSNLKKLHIIGCEKMECLPDWITRLQQLDVRSCTLLRKRYEDPSDPFRSQIELIPYTRIY